MADISAEKEAITKILNDWDFVGVDPHLGGPKDEYDGLADGLTSLLTSGADSAEVERYLYQKIERDFELDPSGLGVSKVAAQLVQWWDGRRETHRRR